MAGPTGIGGLYGKRHLLEEMDTFLFGGEMIQHVTLTDASWNEVPWKFEAGTPPICEAIGLAAAADYLDDIGMDAIRRHENKLAQYALERLEVRGNVETYGLPPREERTGLVSFNVAGIHGHDMSSLLNDRGIAVRAGNHCTQPIHDRLQIPGSVRASFYIYNTEAEIDRLIEGIDAAEDELPRHLSSDQYHNQILDHHRNPRNAGRLADPTLVKSSRETTCGDDGEFHLEVASDGTIEAIAFESDSCAVSQAVASMLSVHLEGRPVEEVASVDGLVVDLLEDTFPASQHDCVVGPEMVIKQAAGQYLKQTSD